MYKNQGQMSRPKGDTELPTQRRQSPVMYIYLDNDGIDSLYSQTVDRLETEFTLSRERDKSGKLKTSIGIGKLLSTLLGIAEIGGETELTIGGKRIDETKSRFTPEQKLLALEQFLQNLETDSFFENLPKAAITSQESGKGVFIKISEKFNMPQFSEGNGVDNINRDKSIAFVIGQFDKDHDFSDTYFKKTQYTFILTAGLEKTTRSSHGMSQTGHDGVIFRAYGGKNVPLNVFGYMIPLSKYSFQIKPYAIWL